jgi:hypothetical protein
VKQSRVLVRTEQLAAALLEESSCGMGVDSTTAKQQEGTGMLVASVYISISRSARNLDTAVVGNRHLWVVCTCAVGLDVLLGSMLGHTLSCGTVMRYTWCPFGALDVGLCKVKLPDVQSCSCFPEWGKKLCQESSGTAETGKHC